MNRDRVANRKRILVTEVSGFAATVRSAPRILLGQQPQTVLRDGLAKTIDYFRTLA